MKKANKVINIILPIIVVVAIMLLWFFASILIGEDLILPSPWQSLIKMGELFGDAKFWVALGGTLGRSLIAFLLSFIFASFLLVLGRYAKNLRGAINILIAILRAIPTIAIILLLLLWTNSKVAAVIVTMLVVLPVIYSALWESVKRIDVKILQMCKIYKISNRDIFTSYIVPQILPSVIETFGRGLSLNIKLMVAAEVLASTANSIGGLMSQSKIYFEIAELFALVVLTIIIAVVIELVMLKLAVFIGRKNGFR